MAKSPGETSDVILDIPSQPPGSSKRDRPLIQLGKENGEVVELNEVFPAESWANAYEAFRSRSYVFAGDGESVPNVAEGALRWLDDFDIRVKPLAVREAKVSLDNLSWEDYLS